MANSKSVKILAAVAIVILFTTPVLGAQTGKILYGRELLTEMRQSSSQPQKPAYEIRLQESVEPQEPNEPAEPLPEKVAEPTPDRTAVSNVTATLQTTSQGDELLNLVPAQSLFCVRVNNFDYTLNQLDQFLAGVLPMPQGLSGLVRSKLAGLLGSPQLTGVKTGGSFALFAAAASAESAQPAPVPDMFIAILIPATDYKQFVTGNPNVALPDEKGLSKITSEGFPAMLAMRVGSFVLISSADSYDKILKYKKLMGIGAGDTSQAASLSIVLDPAEARQAAAEPLWAYANIQQVSKIFAPLVFGKLEQVKAMMKELKSTGQAPMGDPVAIMDIYAGILKTLMEETKSVSLAVTPSQTLLRMTVSVSAVPGTDMADMFTTGTSAKQDNKLLAYLEDGAMMNFACKIKRPLYKKLYAKGIDFMTALSGEAISPEEAQKLKALTGEIIDSLGGSVAESISIVPQSRPPFAVRYVSEVQDAPKFNKLIEESAGLWATAANFYKKFGMETSFTINRAVDTYQGVSIDSAKFAMKPIDTNSPQAQMISAMYGGGFEYRWAMVDKLWVGVCGGADPNSAVRSLIDQVQAGGPEQMSAEIKAALEALPSAAGDDFMVTFNILRLLQMVTAFAPVPLPNIDVTGKSNVVLAGRLGDGKIAVDIALPKEHLTEIMGVIQKMKPQKIPEHQEEQPSTNPPQSDQPNIKPHKESFVGLGELGFGNKYGPQRTIELKIIGVTSNADQRAIANKLEKMVGSVKPWLSYEIQGNTMTAELAPVNNPVAFARKIRFGTVTGVKARSITIQMRSARR